MTNRIIALGLLAFAPLAWAGEPPELVAAKKEYAALGAHPMETQRAAFLTKLVRMRERFAHAGAESAWKAVDAEMLPHPVAPVADAKELAAVFAAKWQSPRHDYLYRRDGSWTMLPADADSPHGTWRLEGNQLVETEAGESPATFRYTLLLLTAHDLVYADGHTVFYLKR